MTHEYLIEQKLQFTGAESIPPNQGECEAAEF
jgi:hypothetical protein